MKEASAGPGSRADRACQMTSPCSEGGESLPADALGQLKYPRGVGLSVRKH